MILYRLGSYALGTTNLVPHSDHFRDAPVAGTEPRSWPSWALDKCAAIHRPIEVAGFRFSHVLRAVV